ncbi:7a14c49c-b90d-442b-97a8-75d98e959c6e [Thermothielavioides terrestris]|uniref:7a14c49c-b90d-442b-97a8-75d98e959c6e n=1 Tax=Thermothielavioides terrestris TaxID=2587410 RepID=A0A446BRT8_9PEZI|nr:7a14c49c-b90d-442b-97a8-75d98e959c6e [Thermothielavioides terrestris]
MRSRGPPLLLLALACRYAAAGSADNQTTTTTAVSVYLPEYSDSDWAALRGSIISSDESVTAYTVFCADQAPSCQIAGALPFVFTEGAHTLVYTGSDPGTLTADLRCQLEGTTAATCTGSSSLGANDREGTLTGPTQVAWTKTFAAADVTWGVLTLSTPPPLPGTTGFDGPAVPTVMAAPTPTSGARGRLQPANIRPL